MCIAHDMQDSVTLTASVLPSVTTVKTYAKPLYLFDAVCRSVVRKNGCSQLSRDSTINQINCSFY